MLPEFTYVKAKSLDEAIDQLRQPKSFIHAGGTDLQGCLRDGVFTADRVISISGLDELRGIREQPNGGISIGALTTISEISSSPLIRDAYPALAQAAGEVATPQLRNQGTLGGNLCQRPRCWYFRGEFYCRKKGGPRCYAFHGENRYHAILGGGPCHIVHPSDIAPALIALGASIRVQDGRNGRLELAGDFFVLPSRDVTRENILQPGEMVTEILLPAPTNGVRSSYRKVRERGSWDFALASVAAVLVMDGSRVRSARIVLGGVAPVPWVATEAERRLVGQVLDTASAREAAEAAVSGAEPMEQNGYKVPLAKGIVEEVLLGLA